jgi:hypothetical protein
MAIFFFKKKLSEEGLIGVWKHPIEASKVSINGGDAVSIYHYEIFHFNANRMFTFGEYSKRGPLYEVKGSWRLSNDKTRIEMFFEDGETNSVDIREYDGKTFVTTSREGNNFKYTKQ